MLESKSLVVDQTRTSCVSFGKLVKTSLLRALVVHQTESLPCCGRSYDAKLHKVASW